MTLTNNMHRLILEHVGPVFFKWRKLIHYPLEYDHNKSLLNNWALIFLYILRIRLQLSNHSPHESQKTSCNQQASEYYLLNILLSDRW